METIFPSMDRHEFFRIVGTSIGAILLTNCAAGCGDKAGGDPTPDPNQKVDFTLRLSDKGNENLTVKGGYVVSNNVIVAQTKAGQFIAVSANCTHEGTQLIYRANDNQFYCPLHLSRFDPTGKVLYGPATQPLTQYIVESDTAAGTIRVHT
ncbi:QcrA and Rieske domain-containing protein [Spirosoma endophyticum]|uniref:Cytochrome b6-f complex iron-sulfur subunit n=1 Tax=Spirosoma endophyticum TaxID=662367 RepID=A0A1I1W2W3_9BACT|nr:Rieske (2Fe-2S) protein [Spirosoma endophyticum]SFD89512.1 cytochrome b6-f complex iron-sulfur subunit [Spirosoma endophyticum]